MNLPGFYAEAVFAGRHAAALRYRVDSGGAASQTNVMLQQASPLAEITTEEFRCYIRCRSAGGAPSYCSNHCLAV